MPGYRPDKRPELTPELLTDAVARIAKRSRIDGECWVTDKGLTSGYTQVSIGGWPFLGHRVAYLHLRGDIPPECTDMDHPPTCVSRACWNPWHVEPVTHAENMARHREQKYGARKLAPIWERQPGYSTERVRAWRKRQTE